MKNMKNMKNIKDWNTFNEGLGDFITKAKSTILGENELSKEQMKKLKETFKNHGFKVFSKSSGSSMIKYISKILSSAPSNANPEIVKRYETFYEHIKDYNNLKRSIINGYILLQGGKIAKIYLLYKNILGIEQINLENGKVDKNYIKISDGERNTLFNIMDKQKQKELKQQAEYDKKMNTRLI
jgi:hypothetical protein